MLNAKLLAPVAMAFFAWAGTAHASPVPASLEEADLACTASGMTLSPATYVGCEGAYIGNDSQIGFESFINGLFGTLGTWSQWAKAEEDNGWEDGGLKITSGQGSETGNFSLTGLTGSAVLVLKAADCFSAYYFTGISTPASGVFNTAAAGLRTAVRSAKCDAEGNVPGVSHLTVYTPGEQPEVIPLPAAGWLLLAGVGGLAAMRRKKAAA